jgi:hypothetical protein
VSAYKKESNFGGFSLDLAGLIDIDYASTFISTDGTMMVASSGNNENGLFLSRIMTVDNSELSRSIMGCKLRSLLVVIKKTTDLYHNNDQSIPANRFKVVRILSATICRGF